MDVHLPVCLHELVVLDASVGSLAACVPTFAHQRRWSICCAFHIVGVDDKVRHVPTSSAQSVDLSRMAAFRKVSLLQASPPITSSPHCCSPFLRECNCSNRWRGPGEQNHHSSYEKGKNAQPPLAWTLWKTSTHPQFRSGSAPPCRRRAGVVPLFHPPQCLRHCRSCTPEVCVPKFLADLLPAPKFNRTTWIRVARLPRLCRPIFFQSALGLMLPL